MPDSVTITKINNDFGKDIGSWIKKESDFFDDKGNPIQGRE